MSEGNTISIKDVADRILAGMHTFGHDQDADALRTVLLDSLAPLRTRGDLMTLGTYRKANHIENSKYLYYDGELTMTLDEFPKGKYIPPHDHGTWEAIFIVRGAMQHTVYQRTDDETVDGHAELGIVEDEQLVPGQITMVVPPSDIHAFTATEESTFGITIVGGEYSLYRKYFKPADKTYAVAIPKGMRT